jgi:predicted O-methyltransferase YrrM
VRYEKERLYLALPEGRECAWLRAGALHAHCIRLVDVYSHWVKRFYEMAYSKATELLPRDLAGRIDLLRPSFRGSWGGPLNGQQRRREIVRDLARMISFDRAIETGTFRGTSTEFFSAVIGAPVETVEANPRFFAYSSRRLAILPDVRVVLGDSRAFLQRVATRPGSADESVFIYLDAHWEDDPPLAQELQIITRGWTNAVVMIDDFQVPGDDGYAFDDYGAGRTLTENYLPAGDLVGWHLFYPSAPSSDETGARRGCSVLVSPALFEPVREVASLRLACPGVAAVGGG